MTSELIVIKASEYNPQVHALPLAEGDLRASEAVSYIPERLAFQKMDFAHVVDERIGYVTHWARHGESVKVTPPATIPKPDDEIEISAVYYEMLYVLVQTGIQASFEVQS